MGKQKKILGLIPARGGSIGIPGKNLAPLAGKPLVAYTITEALASQTLGRVVVSSDDERIIAVAREQGAEAPFVRPAKLSGDASPALAVMRHAVEFLDGQGWRAEVIVYLQPTSPLRRAEHIDGAVKKLLDSRAEAVVSVVVAPHNMIPHSQMLLEQDELRPFLPNAAAILRRQDKPRLFARNGPAVLAVTRTGVMGRDRLYAGRTVPLVMTPEESVDIDTPFDLELAAWLLERRGDN